MKSRCVAPTKAGRCRSRSLTGQSHCARHAARMQEKALVDDGAADYCTTFFEGKFFRRCSRTKTDIDVTGAPIVQIRVSSDGKVVWVHAGKGSLRICGIRAGVVIEDDRDWYGGLYAGRRRIG